GPPRGTRGGRSNQSCGQRSGTMLTPFSAQLPLAFMSWIDGPSKSEPTTERSPAERPEEKERGKKNMSSSAQTVRFEKADPSNLSSLYQHLRVCDVADALDGIGYFNIGLMDPEV